MTLFNLSLMKMDIFSLFLIYCNIISTMYSKYKISHIPFRTLSFLFVIYNNSSYATFGKDAGFFCDDESIKKPYFGDSVQVYYLFTVLLGFFPVIIHISEQIFKKDASECVPRSSASPSRIVLKYYYSGFLHNLAVTEILKLFVTELRPHFYYTCLPDMTNIDCSRGLITDFNCTGDAAGWLIDRDIYKSFPSGHATLSVYAFTFISIYLYSKKNEAYKSCLNTWWSRIIPPLCFTWAVICCISRILDNRHFWWDVLSGISIGIVGGLITIYLFLSRVTQKSKFTN